MNAIQLVQYIRSLVNRAEIQFSDSDRMQFIIANVSRGIAQTLPLPTSPVDVLHTFYANSFDAQINTVINEVNEQLPINTRECRDMVFKFYKLRYEMVFNPFMFSHVLMPMAAALPEYFAKDTCKLFEVAINMKDVDRLVYFRDWDSAVNAVVEHIRNKETATKVV